MDIKLTQEDSHHMQSRFPRGVFLNKTGLCWRLGVNATCPRD